MIEIIIKLSFTLFYFIKDRENYLISTSNLSQDIYGYISLP